MIGRKGTQRLMNARFPESNPFNITPNDVGRYVRRKSTGEVGMICRDPGNGWLHASIVYEWRGYRNDLEYVTVKVEQ